jgi:Leucine-rich repeat (LRR) protein
MNDDDDDDVNGTTVSLIDCGIKSLTSLTLQPRLVSLNLHSNAITKIENLAHLQNLVHLDLSSNRIAKITGLQALVSLRALNLTCNLLVSIENLSGLKKLAHLNLAYNKLQYVHGLGDLWGNEYGLETLLLASNYLSSTEEVTYYLSGLTRLKHVTLVENEFLRHSDYRSYLFKHMRSLISVDGKDRASRPVKPSGCTPTAFLEVNENFIELKR